MQVLAPLGSNTHNLFRPSEHTNLGTDPADLLKCGSCSTEFLLSDIVFFIQHKTKACKINQRPNSQKENILKCSNCSESFRTADGLLKHAQFHHNINIFIEKQSETKNGQTKTKEEKQDQIFIDVIPSESNSMFLDHSNSYNITVSSSNVDANNNESGNQALLSKSSASLDHNDSTNSSCDSKPSAEIEESKKNEVSKVQLDFKNLPPTKRFKNISQMESMNKSDEMTKEDNRLLGLANIALEREDTKTTT
ncbi:zinc finger protein 296-like [Brachionus plicatilis]|uniref:Zinc finger protein 296-like n=1 Tax=Brachionus plicatilis TaxID=10195 RepID=A0A3M7P3X1_BRAPC|nr:zinc finger protein 296-like [Brachionus plicatilis]